MTATQYNNRKKNLNTHDELEIVQVSELEKEGWYRAKIIDLKGDGKAIRVEAEISDFENNSVNYGRIFGWIPKQTDGKNITATFLEAFDYIKPISDVIGKECAVWVSSSYSKRHDKTFHNIMEYAKTEDIEVTDDESEDVESFS
jgi:hypothetical protein